MITWLKKHPRALLLFIAAVVLLLPSYLRAYTLVGTSDAPTLVLGDIALVNSAAYDVRLPYSSITVAPVAQPRREDMVFAELPTHVRAFKRVIGLPGETIEVRENIVIVDGRALPVTPLNTADFSWVSPQHHMGSTVFMEDGHWCAYTPGASKYQNFGPVRLRTDEYFMMGDNRDVSLDSRALGPVARDKILGKMIAVIPRTKRKTGRD